VGILFYSEVPVVPIIADRTLGSFSPSSSSVFSAATAAPPLATVAVPPEASSCSSAAPRVARELDHRLSAVRASPLRRYLSRQQLLAVDRCAVLLPSIIAYLNLNQGCCSPSFAHPLTLFFFSWTRHCRRRQALLPPLRAAVDSSSRPFSSHTNTSSSFTLIP
jgi:hypothetical protein